MAGAVVQVKENAVDTAATTIASGSMGSNVTSGNKLYVIVNAGVDVTITPSKNSGTATIGSFTSLGSVIEAAVLDELEHFVCDVTGTGSLDILITYGASTDRRGVLVVEVSGVNATDVNDEETSTGSTPTSPNPAMSVSVTTQPAFGLAFGTDYQGGTHTVGSGWTAEGGTRWSGVSNGLLVKKSITATGALTCDFGDAGADRSNFCMVVFTDGGGTPVYNAAGQTSSATVSDTLTLSGFAAAAGSDRFLEVWVGAGDTSPAEPTGVTWGGQAMTKRGTAQVLGSFWYHVKYFIKEADFPSGATGDIVASWGPAIDDRTILALVHSNVNQTTPYRNGSQTVEDDGSTPTPSIDVASRADDVVTAGILVVDSQQDIGSVANSAGTERADTGPVGGGYEVASCATVPGATTATITWSVTMNTGVDDYTGMLADSLIGAGLPAPVPNLFMLQSGLRFN